MNKKITVIGLIGAVLLGTLSGCMSGKNTNSTLTTSDEKVEIKIVYPTSRAMGDKDISQFELWFHDSFPDAELTMVSSAVTTITDAVKSDIKNNNGADIFVTTEYDSFVDAGYMADLTSLPVLVNFRKSTLRALERDGKVYAMPLGGGNLIGLHYNKTLFDKYGLEYPKTSESIYDIVLRVNQVITEQDLEQRAMGGSLLYPSQAATVFNGAFSEYTQTTEYLKWINSYEEDGFSFQDEVFQNYLQMLDYAINEKKDENGEKLVDHGKMFGRDDYNSTQASSITSFLNGSCFMYLGDVNRCAASFGTEGIYNKSDIGLMGIPIGLEGVSYVSYMDELYMGISSEYDQFTERKKEIISQILDYIGAPDSQIRSIFTFTGDYCSVYLDNEEIQKADDAYYAEINEALDKNFVAQEVNNTPFTNLFGKVLLAMRRGELDEIVEGDESDIEKITKILETYRNEGINLLAKSEKPIGNCLYLMEYQSNIVRTQETAIGNQVADMAKDYMNADFALLNAGGIRASLPQGEISVQTIDSVLPYENYLVKIRVSGATLKQALSHAYDVNPSYKSGQFGEISGLHVKLKTNDEGYERFESMLKNWVNENPEANDIQKNAQMKEIVEELSEEDPSLLNLELVEVCDEDGNPIEDDKIYTVATLDYLLSGGDDYNMLGVLSNLPEADHSIEIYDRNDNLISGTPEEMLSFIQKNCPEGSEAFADWIIEGHELDSQIDGRIHIEHFIYVE